MSQYGKVRKDGEAKPYADAFGEDSCFKSRTPAIEVKGKPADELSSYARANAAAAEGLLSSPYGPNYKGK